MLIILHEVYSTNVSFRDAANHDNELCYNEGKAIVQSVKYAIYASTAANQSPDTTTNYPSSAAATSINTEQKQRTVGGSMPSVTSSSVAMWKDACHVETGEAMRLAKIIIAKKYECR